MAQSEKLCCLFVLSSVTNVWLASSVCAVLLCASVLNCLATLEDGVSLLENKFVAMNDAKVFDAKQLNRLYTCVMDGFAAASKCVPASFYPLHAASCAVLVCGDGGGASRPKLWPRPLV